MTAPRIFLAAHYTDDAVGQIINQVSQAKLGPRGIFGAGRHATHVYVVAVHGARSIRIDGDVPRMTRESPATFAAGPLDRTALWQWRGDATDALWRMAELLVSPPPYDGPEIAGALLSALPALPMQPTARLAKRAARALPRAAICTRVAAQVFDVDLPVADGGLLPEWLCRDATDCRWLFGLRMTLAQAGLGGE
jgi:hypothetical protein